MRNVVIRMTIIIIIHRVKHNRNHQLSVQHGVPPVCQPCAGDVCHRHTFEGGDGAGAEGEGMEVTQTRDEARGRSGHLELRPAAPPSATHGGARGQLC